jgi:hypothetical protein
MSQIPYDPLTGMPLDWLLPKNKEEMSQIPNEEEIFYNEWFEDKLIIPKPDSVVTSIIHKFSERAKMGKEKYGVTLDRTDLGVNDYLNHLQEELMDGILYLQKMKDLMNYNKD